MVEFLEKILPYVAFYGIQLYILYRIIRLENSFEDADDDE